MKVLAFSVESRTHQTSRRWPQTRIVRSPLALALALVLSVCITAPVSADAESSETWSRIQRNIREREVTEEDLAELADVVADHRAITRIRGLHEDAQGDTAAQDRAWRDMYAAFVSAYPTPDVIYTFLQRGLTTMLKRERPGLRPLGGRGRNYGWYWGHWGRAAVYAYRATGEKRFLDLVVSTYEGLLTVRDDALGLADDVKGRIVHSWGTAFEKQGVRANELTAAGLITMPVTEFLLLLKEDPALGEEYADVAPRFLASVEQAVWEFEEDYRTIARGTAGYYMHPVNREVEALNHTHQLGATMANLYALTGDERYRRRVRELVEYFRACLTRDDNDTYRWPYEPGPHELSALPAESFWKAQATIALPVAAHRHGLAFTAADMRRFARTFTANVWRDEAPLNRFISMRRRKTVDESPPGRRSLYISLAGFIFLDEFDPSVRERIVHYVATHPNECPKAWFGGARIGLLALTYMMATDAAAQDDAPLLPASEEQGPQDPQGYDDREDEAQPEDEPSGDG